MTWKRAASIAAIWALSGVVALYICSHMVSSQSIVLALPPVAAGCWYRSWRIGGLVAAFLFVITVVIVAIFVWSFPPGMRFIQG